MRDLYEDPDFRPYIAREDIRRVLLDPESRAFFRMAPDADTKSQWEIRLDILKYTVWRLTRTKTEGG